jgi:hypothetical protein
LKDFSWNVDYKMPSKILQNIHQQWPKCCLHVKQARRFDFTLDRDLIASQQLVTLEMPVLVDKPREPSGSEWNFLTRSVAGNKSLKVFRPSTQYTKSQRCSHDTPIQFQLGLVSKLPTLEEFRIPNAYYADRQHASQLVNVMSWSSLRTLDIGFAPAYLTEALIGEVPQLKSLSVTLSFQLRDAELVECGKYNVFIEFLRSIEALEELSLKALLNINISNTEWLAIFEVHQNTLKKAKVGEIFSAHVHSGAPLLIPGVPAVEDVTLTLDRALLCGARLLKTGSWVSMCLLIVVNANATLSLKTSLTA